MPRGVYKRKNHKNNNPELPKVNFAPKAEEPDMLHFQNAVWMTAYGNYNKECGGDLHQAPQWVKDEYKNRAREAMGKYVKDHGALD